MNQMTNITMPAFRFTSLPGRTGASLFAGEGGETGNAGGQIGVDEIVYDPGSHTLASFQDSPSLLSLLHSRDGACSFII